MMEAKIKLTVDLGELLHPRVTDSCAVLYGNGHYPQAAFEAMKQVELALREISLAPKNLAARKLIDRVFGGSRGLSLAVPFGPNYQIHAKNLFAGAFGYYRNYGAHDGERIDRKICARVLVLASELLDLLAASERTLPSAGGIEGLVEVGLFGSVEEFRQCLEFYEPGRYCPEETFDGYWEDLAHAGISEEQEKVFWDLGVTQCRSEALPEGSKWNLLDVIELTPFGRALLQEISINSQATKAQRGAG
jgi:uncharacterized protein (TIGR02391 family)